MDDMEALFLFFVAIVVGMSITVMIIIATGTAIHPDNANLCFENDMWVDSGGDCFKYNDDCSKTVCEVNYDGGEYYIDHCKDKFNIINKGGCDNGGKIQ